MIDTGGIEPASSDIILSSMREQAQIAIDMADVIVFMVDGREGVTNADTEVSNMLKKTGKKIILLVNKIDNPVNLPDSFYDFYELGIGTVFPISAANKLNFGDVLDEIVQDLPKTDEKEEEEKINIAIIGKPNAGKSSLVNALIKENRVIVSPIAGTTRDSIDTPFTWNGGKYTLIDTAGIRRKSKVNEDIEKFSVVRAIAAIERSDVAVLMIDAQDGVTEQDKKVAGLAHEAGKGIVIVVNKWDLIEKETNTMSKFRKKRRTDSIALLSTLETFRYALIPRNPIAAPTCPVKIPRVSRSADMIIPTIARSTYTEILIKKMVTTKSAFPAISISRRSES